MGNSPVTADLVGTVGPPFTMLVELGKIREFARATRADSPEYWNDEPLSPPTFLMSSTLWMGPESSVAGELDLDLKRLLHGEQEFIFFASPPRAADVLTGRQRIDKVYEKEGRQGGRMKFAEIVTEFRDEQGNLVAEARATLIETSKPVIER